MTELEEAAKVRDLVKSVDPEYRQAAFEAILLSRLLAREQSQPHGARLDTEVRKRVTESNSQVKTSMLSRVLAENIPEADRYDRLFSQKGYLLEKCLAVLRIVHDKFSVDGLVPGEVERLLIEKFRVAHVDKATVRRELRNSRTYVSRVKEGNAFRYLLTALGESHLDETVSRLEKD